MHLDLAFALAARNRLLRKKMSRSVRRSRTTKPGLHSSLSSFWDSVLTYVKSWCTGSVNWLLTLSVSESSMIGGRVARLRTMDSGVTSRLDVSGSPMVDVSVSKMPDVIVAFLLFFSFFFRFIFDATAGELAVSVEAM